MLSIVLILLIPLNLLFKNTNRFNNDNYEISKYQNVPYQIEFANFGSSHGQLGFYYSDDESITFNFALSSQTPEYDLALLKENLDHFADGATVVFPISYFTPYLFSHDMDLEFSVRNFRYYEILNFQNIIDFNFTDLIKSLLQPLNGREILNYSSIFNDDSIFLELNNPNGNFPLENWETDNSMVERNLNDEAIARWDYWKKYRANLDLSDTGNFNHEILDIYQEIVDICNENNLNPIFVTLPVTAELNMVVDTNFYPIFLEDMKFMMNELGNPTYFDYSHSKVFDKNQKYFIDTDHLSKAGAQKLTEILKSDIQDLSSK